MKKVVALCLTLVLMLGIIPVSSLTASAASKKPEIIFSYVSEDETDKITIVREHTKNFLGYKTRLIFTTTKTERKITTTKSYTSNWCRSFSKTPLTAREICKNDRNLSKADVFSNIESLYSYDQILTNPIKYLKDKALNDFYSEVISEIEGMRDDALVNAIKPALGIKTPVLDFVNDVNSAVDKYNGIFGNVLGYVDNLHIIREQACESISGEEGRTSKDYRALRDASADKLISAIINMK